MKWGNIKHLHLQIHWAYFTNLDKIILGDSKAIPFFHGEIIVKKPKYNDEIKSKVQTVLKSTRMHCKMVFNFIVRHDHAFRSCQTRWPLIGLRKLILIGQLSSMMKTNKTLTDVNNLNTECYVIQSKNTNKRSK